MYLAELLGTFAFVFIGAGAVLGMQSGTGIGLVGVALAHGLALMMIVYTFGMISGAHINPAVTFGTWAAGKMKTLDSVFYIVFQLAGAALAALALQSLVPWPESLALGTPALAKQISMWQGLLLEAVMTFFLVWAVMSTMDKKFPAAVSGLTIGLTLTFSILFGGVLTGAALNPARAFGPALVAGEWANHLVYWAGPLLGALVAALVNRVFRK